MMKKGKKAIACTLAVSLLAGTFGSLCGGNAQAAAKKPKLSPKTLKITVGKSKKLNLKNNKKKVKWTVTSGKKCITLKAKKKSSVTVVGKKAGKAKVQAKIGKKKYTCTVTVKNKEQTQTSSKKPTPAPTGNGPARSSQPTGTSAPGSQTTLTPAPTDILTPTDTSAPTETSASTDTSAPTETSASTDTSTDTSAPGNNTAPPEDTPDNDVLTLHYNESTEKSINETIKNSDYPVRVIIDEGVEEIWSGPFDGCSKLTSIEIPASAEEISPWLFEDCRLTSIKVADDNPYYEDRDDGNTLIEKQHEWKLGSCTAGLGSWDDDTEEWDTKTGPTLIKGNEKSKITDDIIGIDGPAFSHCNLTSIEIPASVVGISSAAFGDCSHLCFKVADGNPYYEDRDDGNTLIRKEHTVEEVPLKGNPDEDPAGMDWDEFKENYLEDVTGSALIRGNEKTKLTDDIVYIGEYAFSHCENLTSVEIPASVVKIWGSDVNCPFSYCMNLKIMTVAPDNPVYYSPEGSNAIFDKTGVYYEEWGEDQYGEYSFVGGPKGKDALEFGCAGTKIPDWVTKMNEPFIGSGLTSIEIPAKIEMIFCHAFKYSYALTEVKLNEGLKAIDVYAFRDCTSLTSIEIPDSVKEIGEGAFQNCSSLTTIKIPANATYICDDPDYGAFSGCTSLKTILWRGVTYSSPEEFFTDFSATEIEEPTETPKPTGPVTLHYNDDNQEEVIKEIKGHSVGDGGGVHVVVDDGVTSIGDSAFSNCYGLTSIEIPNSVTSIGESAFYMCSGLTSIEIPDSVTSIGDSAFCGCSSLTSIKIPNNVTSIWGAAFSGCYGLTSIEIPNSVTNIGGVAFNACTSLTSIEIPDSVTSIGQGAFRSCFDLTSIEIPYKVTSIEKFLFLGCESLTDIEITNGVTSIGANAFSGCSSLTDIKIPDSVTSIGQNAFSSYSTEVDSYSSCSNLKNIEIPDSVTSIGRNAFSGTPWLTAKREENPLVVVNHIVIAGSGCEGDITIPSDVMSIGDDAFAYSSSLESIEIPNGVTSIGEDAFSGCSSLTSIEIPNSVTSIGQGAFSGTPWLEAKQKKDPLVIVNHIVVDGSGCEENITIPSDVTSIVGSAFRGCESLTGIKIPNGVTSIGESTFEGCGSLTSIELPDSLTSIGPWAFYECSSLTSIEIPDSVTTIGEGAFSRCSSLTSIELSDSLTSIGEDAFSVCRSLTSIKIPDSVTSIGSGAFSECESLTSILWKGKTYDDIGKFMRAFDRYYSDSSL